MKVPVDERSIANLIRASRALTRHDKARDARMGIDNCMELEQLEDAIAEFCILYGDPDASRPQGEKTCRW